MQEWARANPHGPGLELVAERRAVAEALQAVQKALSDVELFGSTAARQAVRNWMYVLQTDYGMATRPGGSYGAGVRAVESEEIRNNRDPFLELVRRELGVDD